MEGGNGSERADLLMLPEACIARILSLTCPRDACRHALVCSTFRSAAESDTVWERFLPSDYQSVISRSCPSPLGGFSSKKELYFRLCDFPLLIDEGTKSFSLDKWTGKKCYMLSPRTLYIVWVDTPMYWSWTSPPDSRFAEVPQLLDVCWLEIRGKMNTCMLSPDTNYAAYFVFKWTTGAYGFEFQPVEVSVGVVGGETKVRSVHFDPNSSGNRQRNRVAGRRVGLFRGPFRPLRFEPPVPAEGNNPNPNPNPRGDGWCEVELGEFFNEGGEGVEVEMSVVEVTGGQWKSGLIIQGIEIRPKEGK